MIVIYKEFILLIVKIKIYIYMSNNIYKYKTRYVLGGSSSINENQEANNNQSNKDFKKFNLNIMTNG